MKQVKNGETTIITYPKNQSTTIVPVYYSIQKLGSDDVEKNGVLTLATLDCFTRAVGVELDINEITNGIHSIQYFDSNQDYTFKGLIEVTNNNDESRNYIIKL